MKINAKQLRTMILQEMRMMKMPQRREEGHHELIDTVLHAAGGCPIRARSILQSMLHRMDSMAHEREMQLQRDIPNPATSGEIPRGERLMGDDAYMEQKKPTAVEGPGHSKGIFGPGFR